LGGEAEILCSTRALPVLTDPGSTGMFLQFMRIDNSGDGTTVACYGRCASVASGRNP